MIENMWSIENTFSADLFNIIDESVFAFDFKENIYWIKDIYHGNERRDLIKINKDSNYRYKVSICKTLPLIAYINKNQTSVYIENLSQSKIINIITINDYKVEFIALSSDGKSILIGGNNGVLCRWNTYTSSLLSIISRHKDMILFAKESQSARFVVCVSYDRQVFLYNKDQDKLGTFSFITQGVVESGIFVSNEKLVLLGDSLGYLYVIDIHLKKLIRKFQVSFSQIISIEYYKYSMVFILNDKGILSVIDFITANKVVKSFLPHNKYKQILLKDNLIFLSTIDKKLICYNFDDFISYFISLSHSDIAAAYDFAQQYQFLQNEISYLELNVKYEAHLLESIALACSRRVAEIDEIMHIYSQIPMKRKAISNILNDVPKIDEFLKLMSENMEFRALPMVQKSPILKELKQFKEFEDKFSKLIIILKELAKKGRKQEIISLSNPFKKLPSYYRIIQEVITYPQKVDEAINAYKMQDYVSFIKMKSEYYFVKALSENRILEGLLPQYHFKLLNALYCLDIEECRKHIEILKHFTQYKDEVKFIDTYLQKIERLVVSI